MSPDRLRLLEKIRRAQHADGAPVPVAGERTASPNLEDETATAAPDPRAATEANALVLTGPAPDSAPELKRVSREFYNRVSRQLDASPFGEYAYFLNYGYASTGGSEASPISLPAHCLNRNSVKLVLEVIGRVDLAGKAIADVGCGRGGTAQVIHQFYRPATYVGVDLSAEAVRFCQRAHRYPGFAFVEGDAEHLPLDRERFDVVLNIESSHNYPEVGAFYREVHRILKPGGQFLYADNLPHPAIEAARTSLRALGLALVREVDITENVLRSCDETAERRKATFQARNDGPTLDLFLAVPGSPIYRDLEEGRTRYRIFGWVKSP